MSSYPDYSGDYAYHPGVYDATLVDPSGNSTAVKVRRDVLTFRDFAGSIAGLTPGDTPWVLWGMSDDVPINSRLTVGSDLYLVLGSELRGDLNQQRLVTRKAS